MAVIRSALASSAARPTSGPAAMRSPISLRQVLQAPGLVGIAAELRLEGHPAQVGRMRRERDFAVLFPEKRRIAQARPDDALVAFAHLRGIATLDVAHRDELARQLAVRALDGEIPLVVLDRGDDHFARQRQEAPFEPAHDRHRPFDQGGHLIEQRALDQCRAAGGGRRRRHALADHFPARTRNRPDTLARRSRLS